jgi:hypothetical protein
MAGLIKTEMPEPPAGFVLWYAACYPSYQDMSQ